MVYFRKLSKNYSHASIHLPIEKEPQTRGLEGYRSSSSAHPLLKDLFQLSMESKRLKLESHWEKLGESFRKTYLKEIPFKDPMEITKGCNLNRKFGLIEERESRIRKN
ncbi:hypothetical protein O181_058568 [Austropuccinia psidii MF-1]|uniref:Uncharacterized protein n=1 Tax=Austropuccinia psidii MF-1 TaxID=1389203 RepID=A0A9Q3EDA5_9BASI|nr:hypothetical protein [Austropuccinia psidii MF-1]